MWKIVFSTKGKIDFPETNPVLHSMHFLLDEAQKVYLKIPLFSRFYLCLKSVKIVRGVAFGLPAKNNFPTDLHITREFFHCCRFDNCSETFFHDFFMNFLSNFYYFRTINQPCWESFLYFWRHSSFWSPPRPNPNLKARASTRRPRARPKPKVGPWPWPRV